MKKDEFIETIVVNNHMINVGYDDYGQTYFLEYIDKNGELVEDCVGAYETDYEGYAESIFESPENCTRYGVFIDGDCQEGQTYCYRCPYSSMVIARNERWLETYGVPYPEIPKKEK